MERFLATAGAGISRGANGCTESWGRGKLDEKKSDPSNGLRFISWPLQKLQEEGREKKNPWFNSLLILGRKKLREEKGFSPNIPLAFPFSSNPQPHHIHYPSIFVSITPPHLFILLQTTFR
jgi:hypothetical protein